jgi:hypothetical protein
MGWQPGTKFGMKIWTCIGGSCLGHLQTKTISTLTKKITLSNIDEEKQNKLCCNPKDMHPVFAVGSPQHRMIVCYDRYDWFQQIPFGDFREKD